MLWTPAEKTMSDRALIPRRLLFDNPSRMAPRLSPDGHHLAMIQPRDGVLNIWLAPTDAVDEAVPLTRSTRPLFWCSCSMATIAKGRRTPGSGP